MLRHSPSVASALLAAAALAAWLPEAAAQAPTAPTRYTPGTTGMNNPALRFFQGTPAASPTPPAKPHPAPATATPTRRSEPIEKPFSNTILQPTVTPYLALGLLENSTGMPNYHLFVKPQLDQQRQFQMQQLQQHKLQQQIRAASRPSAPTTGGTARFQNYGSYYPVR